MFKWYMHRRDRRFAMLNDDRFVRPFEWGAEYISARLNGDDPRRIFADYSKKVREDSDAFFCSPTVANYKLAGSQLTWRSAVETPTTENNTVYAAYFPHERNRKSAVIVIPHWNAKRGTYFDLCRFLNRVGLSALRLTLPYHEERMPPELSRADYLVSPNIGRTIQSIRQSVVDTRAAIAWLKQQGYEKVGVVGTSIGSCVAFLAFVHDPAIDVAVFNHVSGHMADVVWRGISTYHVRAGFGNNIELDELREYWLPVSPLAYIDRLSSLPPRPQRYIYTLYDLSFPVELSRAVMCELDCHHIRHSRSTIPCGHYTLGVRPWVYIDGYKIISFLHKHLK